jgi:thiamine biosynthesis lipoprotein
MPTFDWKGIALGAQAQLKLQHWDQRAAMAALEACLEEVARLEAIFSLHRTDSALMRLNAEGRLAYAPQDLRALLSEAMTLAELSQGAFDPTVQPLWTLFARHFSQAGASPDGPPPDAVAGARRLVDWRRIEIDGSQIRLRERGMAITLNGIAQGYITDRVGTLLRERGFKHVLVSMGEHLALGPKWDGEAWRVGIATPHAPGSVLTELPIRGGAVATSGGYGLHFDAGGRFSHILDPRGTPTMPHWSSVTVLADRATLADGLSTALCVAPAERATTLLEGRGRAYVVPLGGGAPRWI